MPRLVALAILLTSAAVVSGELRPSRVTLRPGKRSVAELLKEIEAQTGNRVVDRRSSREGDVDVGFHDQSFWSAIEQLSKAARVRVAVGDAVALVDGRPGPAVAASVCRVGVRSIAVQRDFETDRRTCAVELDVAWEPSLDPLYLTVDNVRGRYGPPRESAKEFGPFRGVAQSVAQRRNQLVDLRLPGPDRTAETLAELSGELRLIVPERMLTVRFSALEPGKTRRDFTEDGVRVALTRMAVDRQLWTFDLEIENPPETPDFESFQSWLDNNRIHLERMTASGKEIWPHRPDDWEADRVGRRAKLKYAFVGAGDKGSPSDWTLVYRTPGRIVETVIPFTLRDVPLP